MIMGLAFFEFGLGLIVDELVGLDDFWGFFAAFVMDGFIYHRSTYFTIDCSSALFFGYYVLCGIGVIEGKI